MHCITCLNIIKTEQNKWSCCLCVYREKKLIFSSFFFLFFFLIYNAYSYSFLNIPISFSVSLLDYVTYNMCMVENIQLEKLLRAREKKYFILCETRKVKYIFYSYLLLCTHKSKKLSKAQPTAYNIVEKICFVFPHSVCLCVLCMYYFLSLQLTED